MATQQTPSYSLYARISPELNEALNEYCDRNGLTKTGAINEALTEYLDKRAPKPTKKRTAD